MTEILLVIVAAQLAYMIYLMKGIKGKEEKPQMSYRKVLPQYLNKTCEITLKEPLPGIDIMYALTGRLVDLDDEWVLVEADGKKTKVRKLVQIENIGGIKEIR